MRRVFYFNKLNREIQHIHLWLAEVIMTALPRIFMFLAWYKYTHAIADNHYVPKK